MPSILLYLCKVSLSLAVVFLFYQLVLRRLTFYNWNRWYLLVYSATSFLVPFIDISPVLERNALADNSFVNWVPVLRSSQQYTANHTAAPSSLSFMDCMSLVVLAGTIIMVLRIIIQFLSFRRMKRNAEYIRIGNMYVYQVNEQIIPFSFGNNIFINKNLHTDAELEEIIRHEFVHVRQRHSIDIIWSEFLCLICWFNPFAWLLKKAVRQNLEFIADNNVLQNGINKKEYQYLLLKVTGNNLYSIATPFNFSSLKKRIAMMNKIRSARVHLLKFMFVLPLVAVLLLAFRDRHEKQTKMNDNPGYVYIAGLVVHGKTMEPLVNASIYVREKNLTVSTDDKGYYLLKIPFENKPLSFSMLVSKPGFRPLLQRENWGNFTEEDVYARYSKTIEYFGLSEDGRSNNSFSTLAGNGATLEEIDYRHVVKKLEQLRNEEQESDEMEMTRDTIPADQEPVSVNEKGYSISITDVKGNCTVVVRDKNDKVVKKLLLTEWNAKGDYFVKLYGQLPPPPPDAPAPPQPVLAPAEIKLPDHVKSIQVRNGTATVLLKNGSKEVYNLSSKTDKENFEMKYGSVIPPVPPAPPLPSGGHIETNGVPVVLAAEPRSVTGVQLTAAGLNEVVVQGAPSPKNVKGQPAAASGLEGVVVQGYPLKTTAGQGIAAVSGNVLIAMPGNEITEADEAISITITKETNREQLNDFTKQMKHYGVNLSYDDISYKENGQLNRIGGKLKSANNTSTFTGNDFREIILMYFKKGEKTWFRINISDDKEN